MHYLATALTAIALLVPAAIAVNAARLEVHRRRRHRQRELERILGAGAYEPTAKVPPRDLHAEYEARLDSRRRRAHRLDSNQQLAAEVH